MQSRNFHKECVNNYWSGEIRIVYKVILDSYTCDIRRIQKMQTSIYVYMNEKPIIFLPNLIRVHSSDDGTANKLKSSIRSFSLNIS